MSKKLSARTKLFFSNYVLPDQSKSCLKQTPQVSDMIPFLFSAVPSTLEDVAPGTDVEYKSSNRSILVLTFVVAAMMHRPGITLLLACVIGGASARSLPGGDGGGSSDCESFSPLSSETCAMLFDRPGNRSVCLSK